MRIGGLMLIVVMVAAACVGFYAIATNVSMTPPVDSAGNAASQSANLTQANVSAVAQVAPTAGMFIALIVAVIILAVMVVYFAGVFRRARRG